ncbi:stromelysin-3 isoform X2 [Denticeps clupeoides]|uniref:Peptidase metallopeptidase domain-containing protein n=1 Tax=Denticeps clupeoides TaxID=299321 RepID=A0AAY4DXK0_9TELE|nr:stromelysin-3 isoform X2 [Denticeps clupeoides]
MSPRSRLLVHALALHLLLSARGLPARDRRDVAEHAGRGTWTQNSSPYGLKKRGREPQSQDTVKVLAWPAADFALRNHTGSDPSNRPRCGVPDYPNQNEIRHGRKHRQKRYLLFGRKWNKTDLTYKIVRFPWQMTKDKVRRVLKEALQVWSDVTPLTFTEVWNTEADIVVDFVRYWHEDTLPFDGPGGILAHAFFPGTQLEGNVHFDYDESWTLGNEMGTDLLQVAGHEFGHVLGLQHSHEEGAIMSPFYSFSYPLRLSNDDKAGIQKLYGAKPTPIPPRASTGNSVENRIPDACDTDFDAVSMIRGELFFFKDGYTWRMWDGKLQRGYPALAFRHWKGIPHSIDAAFEDKTGKIWFFQGHNYWVFDAERKISGPDSLQWLGLPVSHIQAALHWKEDHSHQIYFFKSGSYWRFNPLNSRVDSAYPESIQRRWPGIPDEIDAAFQDRYGYGIFISGRRYWKFDPVERRVLEGYPRYVGMDFFNCNMNELR